MSIHGPLFVLPSINYVKKVGKETEKRSEGGGGGHIVGIREEEGAVGMGRP